VGEVRLLKSLNRESHAILMMRSDMNMYKTNRMLRFVWRPRRNILMIMKRTNIPDISAVKDIAELNIRTLEHHCGSAVQLSGTGEEFKTT